MPRIRCKKHRGAQKSENEARTSRLALRRVTEIAESRKIVESRKIRQVKKANGRVKERSPSQEKGAPWFATGAFLDVIDVHPCSLCVCSNYIRAAAEFLTARNEAANHQAMEVESERSWQKEARVAAKTEERRARYEQQQQQQQQRGGSGHEDLRYAAAATEANDSLARHKKRAH